MLLDLPRRRMTRSRARRRLLLAAAVIIAVALVAGIDGWIVRHLGAHSATDRGADSYLSGIACPTATTCWAVGQSAVARGGNTSSEARSQLIERETGGAWHRVAAPAAPGGDLALTAITCPASRDCWAVGGSSQSGPAIIEHWSGGILAADPLAHAAGRPADERQLRIGEPVLGFGRKADPQGHDVGCPRAVGRDRLAADFRPRRRPAAHAVQLSRRWPLPDRRPAPRHRDGGQLQPGAVEPGHVARASREPGRAWRERGDRRRRGFPTSWPALTRPAAWRCCGPGGA